MTAEMLDKSKKLKKYLKQLRKWIEELPNEKERYTDLEYRTRTEFYKLYYEDGLQRYSELKKKLTFIEKIKLVMY